MLVKNGDYMQIAEATERNNDIIRNVHDTKKINRASKNFQNIEKNTRKNNLEKHQG